MSNVLAALALSQVETLANRVSQRRKIFNKYLKVLSNLPNFTYQQELAGAFSNRWLSAFTWTGEKAGTQSFMKFLKQHKIQNVY